MLVATLALACHSKDAPVRLAPHSLVSTTDGTNPHTTPPHTTPTSYTPPGTTPTIHTVPDGDPWSTVPTPPQLSSSTISSIQAAETNLVNSTVAINGVYILDDENGQVLYQKDQDTPFTPASNTKLFTTGVAFDQLGADHRFEVTAYGDDLPDASGRVGTLTIVGEHDFTWSTFFYESSSFPAERLADQLLDSGVRSIGTLVVSGEYEIEGYELGYYDPSYHREAAADVVTSAFEGRGISVGSTTTSTVLDPPSGGVELARRGSPPLSVACHPLLVYSHNEFADLLSLHDGWELAGEDSWDAGTAAVEDWLDSVGIDTTGLSLNDGSGLSHANTVTPRQVVEMERYLFDRPSGLAWQRAFSTAGYLGTLAGRMTGPDTAGWFHGKSGTLTGVITTSGVLYNRHDGHRYLISALENGVVDNNEAHSIEDQIVGAVAGDLRGLGTRPDRPNLRAVRAPGDGTLVAEWDPVSGADGYTVWLSTDGAVWRRSDGRYVTDSTHFVIGALPEDSVEYVRITATNAQGESEPSDVLAGRSSFEPPQILIVDADDRWLNQLENPMGQGHDFVVAHAAAVGARPFESVANDEVDDGSVDLTAYRAILWQTGEQSSDDETFSDVEQAAVADAVASGVGLLASGAEIGWDLGYLGTDTDLAFLDGTLGVDFVGDDAGTYSVEPKVGGLFDGIGELGFYTPGTEDAAYPDQFAPANGGVAALQYVGGSGGTAGVVSADGLVIVLGFPFESIDTADARAVVMDRILTSFGL